MNNKKKAGLSIGLASLIALGVYVNANPNLGVIETANNLSSYSKESTPSETEKLENINNDDIKNVINDKKVQEEIASALEDKNIDIVVEKNNSDIKELRKARVEADNKITEVKVAEVKEETTKEAAKETKEETKVIENIKDNNKKDENKEDENKVELASINKEEIKIEKTNKEEKIKEETVELASTSKEEVKEEKKGSELTAPKVTSDKEKEVTIPVTGWATHNLNIREKANTNSKVVGVLPLGEKIKGIEKDGWVQFEQNGKVVFVSMDYLTQSEEKIKAKLDEIAKDKAAKEKAEKDAKDKAAKEKAEKDAKDKAAKEKAEKDAKDKAAKEKAEKDAKDKAEKEKEKNKKPEKPSTDSSVLNKVVSSANSQVGKRYVFGATGPNSFDCSGLVYYVYKNQAGITLNRNSSAQASNGYSVSRNNLKPGDLLFFNSNGRGGISHVGIYVGNGTMVHASNPERGVVKDNINSKYYTKSFVTARRIIN